MKKKLLSVLAAAIMLISVTACNSSTADTPVGNIGEVTLQENDVFAIIHVRDYGDITVKLFPEIAPQAVERFMKLALRGYYDGKNFHRVIEDFLIQGGSFTGDGYDGDVAEEEYIDVEVSDYAKHFYGALCFAKNSRKGNYCQFYIVNNNEPQDIAQIAADIRAQLDDADISGRMLEEDKEYYEEYYNKLMAIPDTVREKYLEVGGDFQLDGEYTVFGQTIDGFDVLEAISRVEVVSGNVADDRAGTASKPINDIVIDSIDIVKIAVKTDETESTSKITRVSTTPVMEETTTEIDDASEETSEESASADNAETAPIEETAEDTSVSEEAVDTEETGGGEEAATDETTEIITEAIE